MARRLAANSLSDDWHVLSSPQPGATPFVEVGQVVEPDTKVCIIEVMKLMNSSALMRTER